MWSNRSGAALRCKSPPVLELGNLGLFASVLLPLAAAAAPPSARDPKDAIAAPLDKRNGSQSLTNHAPRLVDAHRLDERHREARRPQ